MPVFRNGEKNILFVHVPKCGGTTVENAFRVSGYRMHYLDGRGGAGTMNDLRVCSPQHLHADLLRSMLKIQKFDAVFMIVRDPIARFQSEYLWRNRWRKSVSPDFRDVDAWARRTFREYETNPYIHDNHIRPQNEFWMPEAIVYRMEDGLETVVADLNERLELGVSWESERINHARDQVGISSSDVEVSGALRQYLTEFYRADYAKFGYTSDDLGALTSPARIDPRRLLSKWMNVGTRPATSFLESES